jgi:hypothetical protein
VARDLGIGIGIGLELGGICRPPVSLTPNPNASLHFADEAYSFGGSSKTLAECLTGFDHSSVVPGEGWVLQGTASASDFVLSTPELFAAVGASNTAVFDVSVVVGAGSNLSFEVLDDDGASSSIGSGADIFGGFNGLYIDDKASGSQVLTPFLAPLVTGDYRIVQSLDPAGCLFCVNHGAVAPYSPVDPTKFSAYMQFFNYIWINGVDGAKITCRSLDFYSLITDTAVLRAL